LIQGLIRGDEMGTSVEAVRNFFAARAGYFSEPYRHIGEGKEFDKLPRPDEYVAVPPPALEACGFYFLNVLQRDNGSVYVFQAVIDGTATFGVLATSDGRDAQLEVYGANGELLGAALIDRAVPEVTWAERQVVRGRAGIDGFPP
jgi:hypothetical protein